FYTTVTNDDIYQKRYDAQLLFADAVADSTPLAKIIASVVDEALLKKVAVEYAKGRRLYIGTTHLDSRRLVQWDMGAIAQRGTPQDLELFRKVILASASIPGFFPPVRLPVTVDGKVTEELHVDGGVTASLFFVSPRVQPAVRPMLGQHPMQGSNLYIVVAGKLYADPDCVKPKILPIASGSISSLLYASTRGDLFQMFALCLATKMNYHLTSVGPEVPIPADATTFDPVEMTALFEAGRKASLNGGQWRSTPPGLEPGEVVPPRAGTWLVSPGKTVVGVTPEAVVPASGIMKK
ncbi:MAG: patatin-like phospholipase family protein, partial [Gemmataceae bacterium]